MKPPILRRIVWVHDEDADLSHYGTYSNQPDSDLSIDLGKHPGKYRYFNPTNCETAEQAQQNLESMEKFNSGQWQVFGCYAEAEFTIRGVVQTIRSGGLYGIEEPAQDYKDEVEAGEYDELSHILAELGFYGIELP